MKENLVDIPTSPFSIDSLSPASSFIEYIYPKFESLQAIGSVFPETIKINVGRNLDKSITSTVNVTSTVTTLLLLLSFLTFIGLNLCQSIEHRKSRMKSRTIIVHHFKVTGKRKSFSLHFIQKLEKISRTCIDCIKLDTITHLVECFLKQPNFNSSENSFFKSFLIASYLFFCMFLSFVYCNMFGSELMIENPIPKLDTINQLKESNLSVIPEASGLLQQLIKSQKEHSNVLNIIKQRIPECYLSGEQNEATERCLLTSSQKVTNQKAVYIQSLYYHRIYERMRCARSEYKNSVNRYYVSKETFLPILQVYIGRKNMSDMVKKRFKFIFVHTFENGLDIHHRKLVPFLITSIIGISDEQSEIESCLGNRFLDTLSTESEQTSINIASLLDIILICVKIFFSAFITLIVEIVFHIIF